MTGLFTYKGWSLSKTPPLTDKVAVITGGSSGIGREIVAQLLLHDIKKVYILARSQDKYHKSLVEWSEKKGIKTEDSTLRTEFVACDLVNIKDVKRVAQYLLTKLDKLDMLFLNAAISTFEEYQLSPQGIETIFAANYVGQFTLTMLLLPLVERTAGLNSPHHPQGDVPTPPRIVVATSSLHMACRELDFSAVTSLTRTKWPPQLDAGWRYARSKLANILFTRQLARRLEKKGQGRVYVNTYFPGNIATEAMDSWKDGFGMLLGTAFKSVFYILGQGVDDGAAGALFLATSKEVEDKDLRGKYFIPIATEDRPSALGEDMDLARSLWGWTEQKIRETLGQEWLEEAQEVVHEKVDGEKKDGEKQNGEKKFGEMVDGE